MSEFEVASSAAGLVVVSSPDIAVIGTALVLPETLSSDAGTVVASVAAVASLGSLEELSVVGLSTSSPSLDVVATV